MSKQKIAILTLIIAIILPIFSGCGSEENYSITNIMLSDSKDEKTGLITENKDTFPNNTNYIYGQANLANPYPDTTTFIQIIWKYTQDKSNSVIHTNTISTNLSGTIAFNAQRPGYNWSQGSHAIEFVIDDVVYATHTFNIGEVPIENQYIESIQTSSSVDPYHNPTSPTSSFLPTNKEIYLTISTTNQMPTNTEVKIEWYYTQNQEFLSSASTIMGPEDQDHFTLSKTHHQSFLQSNGNWPSGGYKARIYVDNKLVEEIRFTVS